MASAAQQVNQNNSRKSYRSPLADIEFNSASDITKYAEKLRQIGRTEQLELHTAADELQALLAHSTGSFFERAAARRKARKVSNHLRRAADHARGMSIEAVKLRRSFLGEYAAILSPPRTTKKKTLNWKA